MSVAAMTERLEALAGATSKLRRSREMAQLWSEIRKADREERRQFALVMSERFAPALSAKFEQVTGIDGPDFIKLVRSLIDMDGDDVRAFARDLGRLKDESAELLDEVSVAEVLETVEAARTDAGRQALAKDTLETLRSRSAEWAERRTTEIESTTSDAPVEEPTSIEPPQPVPVTPASDPAAPELETPEPPRDMPGPFAEPSLTTRSDTSVATAPAPWPSPRAANAASSPVPEARSLEDRRPAPRNAEWLGGIPDGWRRRRALSAAMRDGEIGVDDALELVKLLERESDRRWIIGDLIDRDLSASEVARLTAVDLPSSLRRRLEAAHGGA